jgi:DNA-binding NtrC family response regulator
MARVFIVDDEKSVLDMITAVLAQEEYELHPFSDPLAAIEQIGHLCPDVIITDIKMKEASGFEVLEEAKKNNPEINIILITAFASVDTAVDALRGGAFDYLIKPFKINDLRLAVQRALHEKKICVDQEKNVFSHKEILGESKAIGDIKEMIWRVSDVDSTVLVCGESGTGKELVARALHAGSSRKKLPFVSINCAALPGSLLESELFGYEKGSFTGALNTKIGLIEYADGGTLFLDEIGEINLQVQVKLLRVLQEKEIKRVGGLIDIPVDVRVVAATSRKLDEEVKKGSFREDLFYRLNIIFIDIPPLRRRRDDIPELVAHFTKIFNQKMQKNCYFLDEALALFLEYEWPGNVRELENSVERILTLTDDTAITRSIVENCWGKDATSRNNRYGVSTGSNLKRESASIEKELIIQTLKDTNGRKTAAAKRLNISKQNLQYYLKKFNIK